MRLTIFAATGGIGRHVLEQAVTAGHEVTAVVRDPSKVTRDGVRVVGADPAAADPAAIEHAVQDTDAVLSCLGARTKHDIGVASAGTEAIVHAMQSRGIGRIVVISAAPIGTVPSPSRTRPPKHDPGDRFFMRHLISPLLKAALKKRYADLASMEDIVRSSGLDWTIIRPPQLVDKPPKGRYRTAHGLNLPGGRSISRADVAHLMLQVVGQRGTIKEIVGVAY